MSLVCEVHAGVAAVPALRRLQPIVIHAPTLARVVSCVLDPNHMTSERAQHSGEAIDRGHNRTRFRHLALEARFHEIVLHIDDHKRSLRRLDHIEGMRSTGTFDHARHQFSGERQLMHMGLRRFSKHSVVSDYPLQAHSPARRQTIKKELRRCRSSSIRNFLHRHGRACPGHPRLGHPTKTWMRG
jgi:hypothetical protein